MDTGGTCCGGRKKRKGVQAIRDMNIRPLREGLTKLRYVVGVDGPRTCIPMEEEEVEEEEYIPPPPPPPLSTCCPQKDPPMPDFGNLEVLDQYAASFEKQNGNGAPNAPCIVPEVQQDFNQGKPNDMPDFTNPCVLENYADNLQKKSISSEKKNCEKETSEKPCGGDNTNQQNGIVPMPPELPPANERDQLACRNYTNYKMTRKYSLNQRRNCKKNLKDTLLLLKKHRSVTPEFAAAMLDMQATKRPVSPTLVFQTLYNNEKNFMKNFEE